MGPTGSKRISWLGASYNELRRVFKELLSWDERGLARQEGDVQLPPGPKLGRQEAAHYTHTLHDAVAHAHEAAQGVVVMHLRSSRDSTGFREHFRTP